MYKILTKKISVLIGLFLLLSNTGCQKEEHKEEQQKLQVTSPIIKDTLITKEYVCQIHAIQEIEVRALNEGYLKNIYVDEGQYITKGQRMFEILPLVYKAEYKKAKAEMEYAEVEYKNALFLSDSNVISPNQLALVKAKYEKAKAELELSKVHLEFTKIQAPFNGLVGRFFVRQGSLLEEGELMTTLSDNSSLWVYFNVPEIEYLAYITKVKKDSSVEVSLKMANGEIFNQKGIITAVESEFNNKTGNVPFRATFSNPDKLLRHGETGNIIMKTQMNNAMIIPQKTTFEVLDKKYVYLVNKKGIVKPKLIKVKAELNYLYIVDGLTENDQILFEGINKVHSGEKIKIDYIKPEKALKRLDLYAE